MPFNLTQTDRGIPAAAITFVGSKDISPIIFTNNTSAKNCWYLKSFDVNLLRDWNQSMAVFTVVCNLANGAKIPTFPDVSAYRGGKRYPWLFHGDEIRIYAGYLPVGQNTITASDLSEYSFDTNSQTVKLSNPEGHLLPVFWGFIDTIEQDTTDAGIQRIVSCRDRMEVFEDSRLISLSEVQGEKVEVSSDGQIKSVSGDRANLLLNIANGITGNLTNNFKEIKVEGEFGATSQYVALQCWRKIIPGLLVTGYTQQEKNYERLEQARSFNNFQIGEEITKPSVWLQSATHSSCEPNFQPRFHIWAERPPVTKGKAAAVLQVLNKKPREIINHLALTEERPIDFFASHVNGDFIFGPRVTDFSGFKDRNRFYRTYFHLAAPQGVKLCEGNKVLKLKVGSSNIGTYNKFLVVDSAVNNRNNSLLSQTALIMERYPYTVSDRDFLPPCKLQIISDGTLDSWGQENTYGAAVIVGLNAARRWSRDVNTISMTVLGDPTWYPTEMFQVYNTGLHDFGILFSADEEASENNFKKIGTEALKSPKIKAEGKKNQQKTNLSVNTEAQKLVNKVTNSGVAVTDLVKKSLPRYKTIVVQHKFNSKAFTTTVEASAEY